MTFTEIHGDLFDRKLEENEYYVHCISSDYALGAGIAKQFNKKYNMSRKLKEFGHATICVKIDNVFNLVTKRRYWQKPTYDSLRNSLKILHNYVVNDNIKTLAMPKIGCGLDKLHWGTVKGILKDIFKDTDVNIEVYYL